MFHNHGSISLINLQSGASVMEFNGGQSTEQQQEEAFLIDPENQHLLALDPLRINKNEEC